MTREQLIELAVKLLNLADLNSIEIQENRGMISYDNGVMRVNEPSGIVQFKIEGSYLEKKGEQT